jgi:hypothetical protein
MATNLTEIELDEVSLVDKGANQAAHVVLVKRSPLRRLADWMLRKNGDEYGYGMAPPASPMPMSAIVAETDAQERIARLMEALHESLESIQDSDLSADEKLAMMQQSAAEFAEAVEGVELVKALRDHIESLSSLDEIPAAIAAINKALGNESEGETTMTEPVNTEDTSVVEKADDVAKALASEVEKREALEKKLAEMERVAKRAEVAARVEKTMGAVPGASGDDLVGLLMAIHDGAGADVAGKVEALLVASSAAISESAVLDEVGKAAGAEVDAMSRARALADELRKNSPSMTKEIALAKVFDTHPELAAAVYAR